MKLPIVIVLLLVYVVNVDSSTNVTSVDHDAQICELSEHSSTFLRSKFSSVGTDLEILTHQVQAQNQQIEAQRQQIQAQTQQIESQKKQLEILQKQLPPKYCPFGFEYLPEIDQCLKLVLQPMNWNNARETCRSLVPGAKLAAITNHAKQAAVTRYLQNEFIKPGSAVCVLSVWTSGGKAAWISGQTQDPNRCRTPYFWKPAPSVEIPFSYTNWIPGLPDCWNNSESCILIASGQGYRWNDGGCHLLSCSLCEL